MFKARGTSISRDGPFELTGFVARGVQRFKCYRRSTKASHCSSKRRAIDFHSVQIENCAVINHAGKAQAHPTRRIAWKIEMTSNIERRIRIATVRFCADKRADRNCFSTVAIVAKRP